MRETKIKIKIGDGTIQDLSLQGFYLMESDDIVTPHLREYDEEDFPEKDGVNIDNRTTYEAFDYKVKLLCLGAKGTVIPKVIAFYNSLFKNQVDTDIKIAEKILLQNLYYGIQVEGYAKSCNPDKFITKCDGEKDAYIYEFILRVANPKTLISL